MVGNMRIIIEIDGGEMTVKTVPNQAPPASLTQARVTLPTQVGPTAPPEVLWAAAALGAMDAGPAPTGGAPIAPIPLTGESGPVAGPHDMDAGAAPGSLAGGDQGM